MKITSKEHEKLVKFIIHNIQGVSFSYVQKALRKGDIKVNGKRVKQNIDVFPKDEIDIYIPQKSKPQVPVIFEDENILIVNKPQGLECASRDKSSENTYSLEELFADKNAIVVHRLDRLTEGLVILAKSKDIAKEFEEIFRTRQIEKSYLACVTGNFESEGIKKAYLKKDSQNSLVSISETEKPLYKEIITEFSVIEHYPNATLVEVKLHTGRTHQIRAHLNFLGHPIVNDSKYGKDKALKCSEYAGYFLTAYKLKFNILGNLKYLNEYEFEIVPSWHKPKRLAQA